jgi:hypothetical protein
VTTRSIANIPVIEVLRLFVHQRSRYPRFLRNHPRQGPGIVDTCPP